LEDVNVYLESLEQQANYASKYKDIQGEVGANDAFGIATINSIADSDRETECTAADDVEIAERMNLAKDKLQRAKDKLQRAKTYFESCEVDVKPAKGSKAKVKAKAKAKAKAKLDKANDDYNRIEAEVKSSLKRCRNNINAADADEAEDVADEAEAEAVEADAEAAEAEAVEADAEAVEAEAEAVEADAEAVAKADAEAV
jgi:SH3-like domain-containing protein